MPIVHSEAVEIPVDDRQAIGADLHVPAGAIGLVVFAHGSGSSRFSSRNRAVADSFHARQLGTLLLDLLTPHEEAIDVHTREFRFDIPRLGARVVRATDWLQGQPQVASLAIGYFGASTGAAAALIAAADRPAIARAVVSRGGRPDLADAALPRVTAPTLLIVGANDEPVMALNHEARKRMKAEVRIAIVPGATHLFEEPGTMEQVQRLAGDWFVGHFRG